VPGEGRWFLSFISIYFKRDGVDLKPSPDCLISILADTFVKLCYNCVVYLI